MQQLKEVTDCYDATAEEYAAAFYRELEHKPFDRMILERFARENQAKGAIADLGCGSGQTTKFLADLGVSDLIGIDLSPKMIETARRLSPEIKFETGNMLELSQADETFGGALAFYSIVHFDYGEVEKTLAEVYRVLKPAGQFLFSFHVGEGKKALDEFLNQQVNVTFYFFEVDKIVEIAGKIGFKTIDALIRYPYKDKEYPSQRAYIWLEK